MKLGLFFLSLALLAQPRDTRPVVAHESLQPTLWMQTSVEYGANTRIIYKSATEALRKYKDDLTSSAALEQTASPLPKEPAVILDLDETALDNSAYQARLVLRGASYDSASWFAWMLEKKAAAIPGAAGFCRAAHDMGVAVFYISNRRHFDPDKNPTGYQATKANLEALGFPVVEGRLLLRDGQPGWDDSKVSRRAHVAQAYRVVLLLGDDLNDFLNVRDLTIEQRSTTAAAHASKWGDRWFMLPNAMYGSFDAALTPNAPTMPDRLRAKETRLDPKW